MTQLCVDFHPLFQWHFFHPGKWIIKQRQAETSSLFLVDSEYGIYCALNLIEIRHKSFYLKFLKMNHKPSKWTASVNLLYKQYVYWFKFLHTRCEFSLPFRVITWRTQSVPLKAYLPRQYNYVIYSRKAHRCRFNHAFVFIVWWISRTLSTFYSRRCTPWLVKVVKATVSLLEKKKWNLN